MKTILIAGASGFVGNALVEKLQHLPDTRIRAIASYRSPTWESNVTSEKVDLRYRNACEYAVSGCSEVYNLAAKVGGIHYIEEHKADCMLSSLINTHLLLAASQCGAEKYFFSSSACVYPSQEAPLKEEDAYPARPSDGYGWEKLFSERMCGHFKDERNLETRVARYFTLYGPGDFKQENAHVIEALCTKIISAKIRNDPEIEIWGDGEQTRNFLFIDDCIEGTLRLMKSDFSKPLNMGSSEVVSVNQIVDMLEEIADFRVTRIYKPTGVQGVRNRSSDNSLCRRTLGWEPSTRLRQGLELTYSFLWDKLTA